MRNVVTSAEKLWVRTFKTGYKEVTLAQQSFNPAPCGYEDAEFTRTDLSKAAVAAALEAALAIAHEYVDPDDEVSLAIDIRALITPAQHDALAAHVAAEVAKARAEAYIDGYGAAVSDVEAMRASDGLLRGQSLIVSGLKISLTKMTAQIGAKP